MTHLRRSSSSNRSLSNARISNSLKRLASNRLLTSSTSSSLNYIPSIPSIKGQTKIEFHPYQSIVQQFKLEQKVELVPKQRVVTDYYLTSHVEMVPIVKKKTQYIPVQHRKSWIPQTKLQKVVEYIPIQRTKRELQFKKVDKKIVHQSQQFRRAKSLKHIGIRPRRKVRLQDRKQRQPYPDSRPKILNNLQYSICRVPSPQFVRSGVTGQCKMTRIGAQVKIRQYGSKNKNPARYSITKFQQSKNELNLNRSISKNQSPNLSPQSLSPRTSRVLSRSMIQPLKQIQSFQSPPQSPCQSPITSLILPSQLPPLSIRPSSPSHNITSFKKLPDIPLATSQVINTSPRGSFAQNQPIMFVSRANSTTSSQDQLCSEISGSGIITNRKSMTLNTAPSFPSSSGVFNGNSIKQINQYQLNQSSVRI